MIRSKIMPLRNTVHSCAINKRLSYNPRLHIIRPTPLLLGAYNIKLCEKLPSKTTKEVIRRLHHKPEGGVETPLTMQRILQQSNKNTVASVKLPDFAKAIVDVFLPPPLSRITKGNIFKSHSVLVSGHRNMHVPGNNYLRVET